jgi:adenylylsulfate kinase-like enzyme
LENKKITWIYKNKETQYNKFMDTFLYIFSGLPGTGKSTLAKIIA